MPLSNQINDRVQAVQSVDCLIKGKNVTGFSNEQEKLAELDKLVPFLTDTELVSRGGAIRAAQPWLLFAFEDTRLITGPNPVSGGTVADLLIGPARRKSSMATS